jgi:hypothetical protein
MYNPETLATLVHETRAGKYDHIILLKFMLIIIFPSEIDKRYFTMSISAHDDKLPLFV